MSEKFGRSYRLVIDPKDGQDPIVVALPLSIQFWCQRDQLQSANLFTVDIYNLGKKNRDRIFQDKFEIRDRTITFEAGYDTLSLVFRGEIFEANSSRDGTNIITRIEAKTGNFDLYSTQTFETIQKGRKVKDILDFLIGQFPTLEKGAVGDYNEVVNRPVVLNGNTYDLLKKYSDNDVFVDNNRVFVMKRGEAFDGDIPIINKSTGLLETPRRNEGSLSISTLLEPRVGIGQIIDLESDILPVYNGQYKVIGLLHEGMISEAVGGIARSTFYLWTGNNKFQII